MAGSFFGDPNDPIGIGQQATNQYAMAAQMRSMMRPMYSGFQDALTSSAGSIPNAAMNVMQPVGDALNMTARQLDKLTQIMQRSPLLSGQSMAGGQMSGGQLFGAALGFPVQVQGLGAGQSGMLAGDLLRQNAAIASANLYRNLGTNVLPNMAGAALSFLPGGLFLGPTAAAAGQAAMPMLMRMGGADVALSRPGMSRMLQMTVGEQLGGGNTVERFRRGAAAGETLGIAAAGFIYDEQRKYGGGAFALNAEEYQPIVQAVMSMQDPRELKRMTQDGGKRLRQQMRALVDISADLNLTFADTAKLGESLGAGAGGVTELQQLTDRANRAASGGGISSRAGLVQFGVAMRDQARLAGLASGPTMGNVMSMVEGVTSTFMEGRFRPGQLESFGGNTVQERAQNMVAVMQTMGQTLSNTGYGRMVRGSMLAGRGAGGNFMDMAMAAGSQYLKDPFGMVISETDPFMNAQVANAALPMRLEQLTSMSSNMFGDERAGQAFAIRDLQAQGLTGAQAGTLLQLQKQFRSQATDLLGGRKDRTPGELIGAAMSFGAATGRSIFDVFADLKDPKKLSIDEVFAGKATLGKGDFKRRGVLTDAAITEMTADFIERERHASHDKALLAFSGDKSSTVTYFQQVAMGLRDAVNPAASSEREKEVQARAAAFESNLRNQQRSARFGNVASSDVSDFLLQNQDRLSALGVNVAQIGEEGGFERYAGELAKVDWSGRFGMSNPMASLMTAYATGAPSGIEQALKGVQDKGDINEVIESLNAVVSQKDNLDRLKAMPEFRELLSDDKVDSAELKDKQSLIAKLMMEVRGTAGLTTLQARVMNTQLNFGRDIENLGSKLEPLIERGNGGTKPYLRTGP